MPGNASKPSWSQSPQTGTRDMSNLFDKLIDLTDYMTLVDVTEKLHLYYWGDPSCSIWLATDQHFLCVSYFWGESREEIWARVEHWKNLTEKYDRTREILDRIERLGLNYLAYREEGKSLPRVYFRMPGDWMGMTHGVYDGTLPKHKDQLPPDWPETYRSRIRELLEEYPRASGDSKTGSVED